MLRIGETSDRRDLQEQVDSLLPAWRSWYPSLFEAAADLGLIHARVCAPSLLMLSHRHANVRSEALQAFKEQWCVEEEPPAGSAIPHSVQRHIRNSAKQRPPARRTNRR